MFCCVRTAVVCRNYAKEGTIGIPREALNNLKGVRTRFLV